VTAPPAPHDAYTRRLRAHQEREARCERRLARLRRLRRFFIGLIVVLAMLAEREKPLVKLALIGVPAVLLERLMAWQNRLRRAALTARRAAAFSEERLAALEGHWPGHGDAGDRYRVEDHPYAADLDLFGVGSLFERLSLARARLGGDTLAGWLLAPAQAEVVRERQSAVAELRDRLDLTEDLALLGDAAPAGAGLTHLDDWANAAPVIAPAAARAALGVASVAVLGGLVLWTAGAGPGPLLGVLLLGGGLAWWLGNRLRRVVRPVESSGGGMRAFAAVLARLEREPAKSPRLARLRAELNADGVPAARAVARLAALLRRLTWSPPAVAAFLRTHLACAVAAWHRTHAARLPRWRAAADEFVALTALAAYSFENPDDPFPELTADGPCFDAEAQAHPLLPRDRGVPNDLALGGGLRVLVVSGSNMSGKSTLLRTVGANAVLALAGAPVRARRLRLSPLALGATLRVQDSLQAGRSRFGAELDRLRRLLELAAGPVPLLFLLDELFSGTNAPDRQAGAAAVVRRLIDAGAIGLVTTHDLALTDLADALAPRVANVHFADQFADGGMRFDYRMRPGVVPQTNARALMRAIGLDV
jgi:hypothetical protein